MPLTCYFHDTPAYDSTTTLSQVESVWSAPESLNVIGRNFPANALVYILLYVEVQDPSAPTPDPYFPNGNYQFIYGQVLVADSGGFVNLPLIIQLESGKQYLLVASTDSDGNIQLRSGQTDESRQSRAAPWVIFSIPAGASSCPGTPPQRITVNQRGYVCTGSDPVWLGAAFLPMRWFIFASSSRCEGTQYRFINAQILLLMRMELSMVH